MKDNNGIVVSEGDMVRLNNGLVLEVILSDGELFAKDWKPLNQLGYGFEIL